MAHIPVLLNELVQLLDPQPNEHFVDATIGNGGHAAAILARIAPNGKLLGIDWNHDAIMKLREKFESEIKEGRLFLETANFATIAEIVPKYVDRVSGIYADLGMSTEELEESGRGFSFRRDEPLLMTYDAHPAPNALTAATIVNRWPESKLTEIFREFGEEPFAKRYARAIVRARERTPIRTARQLAELIEAKAPRKFFRRHPATKVFQALRIAVNQELDNLTSLLRDGFRILAPDGRMAIISYHSLEDRIVKREWQGLASQGKALLVTKKPVRPSAQELKENPRARSAKLRAIRKISSPHTRR